MKQVVKVKEFTQEWLDEHIDNTFAAIWAKKVDGSDRLFITRNGVTKGVTGKGLAYDPQKRGNKVLYDLTRPKTERTKWRTMKIRNIYQVSMKGKVYIKT